MFTNALTLYRKGMVEILRDRRAMIQMVAFTVILIPVFGQVVIGLVGDANEETRAELVRFALSGPENLEGLAVAFSLDLGFERTDLRDGEGIDEALKADRIVFGLKIPVDAQQQLHAGAAVVVTIVTNDATLDGEVRERIYRVIQSYSDKHREARMVVLGVPAGEAQDQLLRPVEYTIESTASLRETIGERVGSVLPFLLVIYCFSGCMYCALEQGAGEKERGTLETLLLLPVPRSDLAVGKFLVIATMGLLSTGLTIASIAIWLLLVGSATEGALGEVLASIELVDLALIVIMLVPVAALFSGLLLAVSIYARSVKEAYGMANMFMMVMLVPVGLAMLPGVELSWRWAWVPITNISLAIKELLKGTMDYTMLLAILASSTVIAGGFLLFCSRWFAREAVLFRE